ncbi:hypothetical protein FRB90_011243, partial [Tulasnella sp. 427]
MPKDNAAFNACSIVSSILDLATASGIVYEVIDPSLFWKFPKSRIQNGADISTLLSILDEYTRTVWIFVNNLTVNQLQYGDKVEIRLARDSIAAWYFQLEQALQVLKDAGLREKNSGFFRRARCRRALKKCVKELTTANERLEDAIAGLVTPFPVLSTPDDSPVSIRNPLFPSPVSSPTRSWSGSSDYSSITSSSSPSPERRSSGLSFLEPGNISPSELTIVRTLPPTSSYRHSFWNGFVEADVRGQAKLVKVYRSRRSRSIRSSDADDADSEVEFFGDLHNLQQRTVAQYPKVFGFCNDASATFLVFDSMCFIPFKQVVTSLEKTGQSAASQNLWRQYQEMFNAVQFLVENHNGVTWTFLEFTLSDARVDDRGTVVVSPRWINTDMSGWDDSRSKFLTTLERLRHRFFEGESLLRTFKSLFYPYRRRWEQRMYGAVTTGLPESSDLLDRLSQFCPADYSKEALRWPLGTVTSDGSIPRPGDVGYFEEGESMCEMAASFGLPKGYVSSFRCLGNVVKDAGLGGIENDLVRLQMVQYENLFGTRYATISRVGVRTF